MGLLVKLFKALNSDSSPWQLAFGFAFGMVMGLTPLLGLHSLLLLFIVLFFRVNVSGFLVSWAAFSLLAMPLSLMFSNLGEGLLLNEGLHSIWTALYSSYLGQLSQFYHTLTLGSLLVSVIFFPLVLIGGKKLIEQYRQRFMQWLNQWRIVQFIKGTHFYQLYQATGA
ncbi:MAG: TIGR03546 family protein [Paraglaciecola sp.]|nr:TIGR03546 family protein [Paraglaciecola sp.]